MKKLAFSLAETLTTLLIIGAVAAMLIPSLQKNVSKQKHLSMLKKLYSSFSINVKTVLANGNCASISCLRRYGNKDDIVDPSKKYQHNGVFADAKYFNVAKECSFCITKGSVMTADMIAIYSPSGKPGEADDDKPANFTTYLLANGAVMALYDFAGNCTETAHSYVKYGSADAPLCGIVVFDVNGTKAPNTPGRDRFAYYITDEPAGDSFLVPIGYKGTDKQIIDPDCWREKYCEQNPNTSDCDDCHKYIWSSFGDGTCQTQNTIEGYNCTAKIMLDGWKMDY